MMISQQNSVFIAPEECGSSIGYYLTLSNYYSQTKKETSFSMSGNVVLTDCTHKIDWSFGEDDLAKIDAAIKMLHEFRKNYIAMEKHLQKLRGR